MQHTINIIAQPRGRDCSQIDRQNGLGSRDKATVGIRKSAAQVYPIRMNTYHTWYATINSTLNLLNCYL